MTDINKEALEALIEARVNLTTTFRDMGKRRNACIAMIDAVLEATKGGEDVQQGVDCPECGGVGWIEGVEAGCCGNASGHGCCGVPVPVQTQEQCSCCGGGGLVEPAPQATGDDLVIDGVCIHPANQETSRLRQMAEQVRDPRSQVFSPFWYAEVALWAAQHIEQIEVENKALMRSRDANVWEMAERCAALRVKFTATEQRAEKMREALKPFADAARECIDPDDADGLAWESPAAMAVRINDFRNAEIARADTPETTLSKTDNNPEKE